MHIFTLTTGRSGTKYLAELFRKNVPHAEVHHERLSPLDFGVNTPDISTMLRYNHGQDVRDFWVRKAGTINSEIYIETTHTLCKAGLIENLDLFPDTTIICLKRNPEAVINSMTKRGDYTCITDRWLWHIGTHDPINLIKCRKWNTRRDIITWYVKEMAAREARFRKEYPADYIDVYLEDIADEKGAKNLISQFFDVENFSYPGVCNKG